MASIVVQTRSKVKKFLREAYGKQYNEIVQELDGSFIVRRGSAAVHVSIKPLHKTDCLVQARAYVVQGAKIGPKVLGYLMRLNATNVMGAYGLLFDDTITFSHTIAGANLDANELRTTVATVAFVADESDEDIMKMAGGMRAVDAIPEMTNLTEMPLKKAAKKKAPAKKKVAAKKVVVKKAPAKKAAVKKPVAKKPAPKKPAAKRKGKKK
jgi:type III secretion system-like peptide-binding chaperone